MNKRFFAGRSISAFLFDGTKKYKKSGQGISLEGTGFVTSEDAESLSEADREKQRLEAYAAWLEKDEEQNGK